MRNLSVAMSACALALAGAACAGSAPEPAGPPAPLTVEELDQVPYSGFETVPGPVTLANGTWEDEPNRLAVSLPRGFHVLGDLDGAAPDEAVVLLAESTGGSGTFNYLAVVGRRDGRAVNVATVALGDRVGLRDLRIDNGRLVADLLQAGPDDAMCCPGELVTREWVLDGADLVEQPSAGEPSRLSFDVLGGATWVLRSWTFDEDAPDAPQVTLEWRDGALSGASGCNRYTAQAAAGEAPGDMAVGPVAGTRMMCPDPAMQVEERYLRQLERVMTFGFMLGRLALTYRTDDGADVMLFERRR